MANSLKDYMNVKEAASLVGVTDARIRQMLLSKELRGIKAAQSLWLIPVSEVERLANQSRRPGGRPRISD